MQVQRMGYRIRGFYRVGELGYRLGMHTNEDTQRRLNILQFWEKHGLAATQDAFTVSRRTLYRWKKVLTESGGNPAVLARKSSAPKHRRGPQTDPRLVTRIRELRRQWPNLGKAKLHVLLEPWCKEQKIPLPSVSSIGRIIARAPDKMRHSPQRIDSRGRWRPLRRVRKTRKPKGLKTAPLTLWAVDTIERVREGLRRYILTVIDPCSAIAFAVALPSKHARHSAAVAQALIDGLAEHGPLQFLSDNGSEFQGHFEEVLQQHGLTHFWTYPKSPKMNAHVERFNRTIQEQFVDYHEDLLFSDLELFNQKLAQWLITYNTTIPHHRLQLQSPVQWLLSHHPECQRYWTNTEY